MNKVNVGPLLATKKEEVRERHNKKRKDEEVNENFIIRPRVRKLDNPKRFIKNIRKTDIDHYEETRKNSVKNILYKNNFQKLKKYHKKPN